MESRGESEQVSSDFSNATIFEMIMRRILTVVLLLVLPVDASVVEQQHLEPGEGRRLRTDSYIEAVEGPIDDTKSVVSSQLPDLFDRPKQDAVKCCVCSAVTESSGEKYGKCASETLKVKQQIENESRRRNFKVYAPCSEDRRSKIESACPKTAPLRVVLFLHLKRFKLVVTLDELNDGAASGVASCRREKFIEIRWESRSVETHVRMRVLHLDERSGERKVARPHMMDIAMMRSMRNSVLLRNRSPLT